MDYPITQGIRFAAAKSMVVDLSLDPVDGTL